MDPMRGHCNRTRYVVRQVSRQYIEAEIACGEYAGNVLFILRIPLSPTSLLTDSYMWRRRDAEVRKSFISL